MPGLIPLLLLRSIDLSVRLDTMESLLSLADIPPIMAKNFRDIYQLGEAPMSMLLLSDDLPGPLKDTYDLIVKSLSGIDSIQLVSGDTHVFNAKFHNFDIFAPLLTVEQMQKKMSAAAAAPPVIAQDAGRQCCTRKKNGTNYIAQTVYRCEQCGITGGGCICEACALRCHKGHTGLSEASFSPCSFCDCPDFGTCGALKKPPKSS